MITEQMLIPYSRASREVLAILENFVNDKGLKGNVIARVKDTHKVEAKMKADRCRFEEVYDVTGLRVILHYLDEIYLVGEFVCNCKALLKKNKQGQLLGELTNPDDFAERHYEDYVKNPRGPTAYRTLQLVVYRQSYHAERETIVPLEVQIRTYLMHAWEEKEWSTIYKPPHGITPPDSLRGEFYYISKLLHRVDEDFVEMRDRVRKHIEESRRGPR